MEVRFTLRNIEEAANQVLSTIGEPQLVAFYGEMGAGKTTLITVLCKLLGVAEVVSSPTYSIINEYETSSGTIYHLDLYRLADEEEAVQAGVEDCFYNDYWTFVEWPERTPELFPEKFWKVSIQRLDEDTRSLNIRFN